MNENTFSEQNAPSRGEIVLYQTADGRTSIDVKLENETVWLSKEQMAMLFERDRTVISRHIKNIFEEGELDEKVVCAKFAHTTLHGALEGKTQTNMLEFYNLDVIFRSDIESNHSEALSSAYGPTLSSKTTSSKAML